MPSSLAEGLFVLFFCQLQESKPNEANSGGSIKVLKLPAQHVLWVGIKDMHTN